MTSLTLRLAQPEDYGAIARIYNEAIAHGGLTMDGVFYTAATIAAIAEKMTDRECFLIAATATQVVGWGVIKRYSDRLGYQACCETSIYLSFSETGNGYGTALQKALMAKAIAYNYHHIIVKIVAGNQSSIRFHERFGFELVGIQKEIGYMNGTWYDIAIMQCLLPQKDSDL